MLILEEKIHSTIKIGEASTHEIEMPYIVINGEKKGKILCVIGGIHPLEYASIVGVQRIAQEIMPNQLMGKLILIPVVNTEGFNARSAFNNQIDYVNQNRVFPGDPEGTMSRRVANGGYCPLCNNRQYYRQSIKTTNVGYGILF